MGNLIRTGRLEVETDVLLGVEDVLLPRGATRPAAVAREPDSGTTSAPAPSIPAARPSRGFDADLFAARPAQRASGAPATQQRPTQPAAAAAVTPAAALTPRVESAPAAPEAAVPLIDSITPPSGASRAERLAALEKLHASQCPHCASAQGHTNLVFGEGNAEAELVFVGEAPGETEDRTGRPFVGPAGEKLDEMIVALGLRREDVYIANVLKARPPNNRTPLTHEVERCGPYLLAQLAIIRPKAIVTLGGPATKLLLATELGITRLRGVPAKVTLGVAGGQPFEVPVMPTFHPAYLLRNYTVETRRQVWSDLKQALAWIGREPPQRRA